MKDLSDLLIKRYNIKNSGRGNVCIETFKCIWNWCHGRSGHEESITFAESDSSASSYEATSELAIISSVSSTDSNISIHTLYTPCLGEAENDLACLGINGNAR